MCTLYKNIQAFCEQAGIKPGKMCADIGISRGLISDLKHNRKQSVHVDTAQKIADYFNVSVDRVLGLEEQKNKPTTENGDELSDVKREAWNVIQEMDDETLERFLKAAKAMLGEL